MKKRILSLLLILVMTLSLLPTAVLADEAETDYGITIVSPDATTQIDVTSKNYKDVMLDGTVSYDPETCRLVGQIVNVNAEESVLDASGNIDPDRFSPIIFDPIHHTYRKLGDIVGNAFEDGAMLK